MKKFKLIAGIDVSKDTLDVQYCRTDGSAPARHFQCANSAKGIHELFSKLSQHAEDQASLLICCEHTGVYMDKLSAAVQSLECTFWPVHPLIIKNYQSGLQRLKTDKADAGRILEFACNHQHKAQHYSHKDWQISQIQDLFRLKKQLTRMLTQLKNYMHAHKQLTYASPVAGSVYWQMHELVRTYIAQCESEIKVLIKQSPEMYNLYKILLSIPGIGPVTSVHLLVMSECFKKIDNYKSFACFIGIAPFEHSSGSSVRKRPKVSKMGHKAIKADIHQGAMSIIRPKQLFYEYYQKMRALNKHHNWIINAISNKIAKLAFDLINKNQLFDLKTYLNNKNSLKNNLHMS